MCHGEGANSKDSDRFASYIANAPLCFLGFESMLLIVHSVAAFE